MNIEIPEDIPIVSDLSSTLFLDNQTMGEEKHQSPNHEMYLEPYEPQHSEEFEPLTAEEIQVKIKGVKQENKEVKTTGVLELFRFSDGLDKILMLAGTLCASINGATLAVWNIVFGDMVEAFVGTGAFLSYLGTVDDFLTHINRTKLEVLADPSLYNCSDIHDFYNGSEPCFMNQMQERILDEMLKYAIFYCCIGVAVIVFAYGQVMFWMTSAERQAHRIRQACLTNVLRQNIGWFDTHDVTELNTRLTDDVHKIQEGLGDKVSTFLQWSTSAFFSVLAGFVYGWKLCLVVLAASPLLVVSSALFSKLAASISNKEFTAYAQAGVIAEEVFGAIRTVVSFGGQEKEAQRYQSNLQAAQAFGIKKGLSNGLSMGFMWFAIYCLFGLGFWYGGKLFREGNYDTSDVVIVIFCILVAAFSLGSAAPSLEVIATARGAAYTIFQLIDSKSTIDSFSEEGIKSASVAGNIKLEDVHFAYPARPDVKVLKDLSLEAKQGQTVALVGASGCGKTSIVHLLLRFYDPQNGKVMIDGHDIKDYNVKWLRQHIGLVSQEPILFATTIAENIRYGRDDVTMNEIEEATKHANAYDFIMKLPDKFETMVGERGAQLSGGQKQRLAIARALVRDPKILLLDEATSALDTESESIVQDALDKARKGRTTLVIAHRLSTIKTADIIIGIADGQVAEVGTHSELMDRRGHYYTLVMNQQAADTSKEDGEEEDLIIEDHFHNSPVSVKGGIAVSTDRKGEKEEKLPDAPFNRIMKLNLPEWYWIFIGCLGSVANGAVMPTFAVVFGRILKTFSYSDMDTQKREIEFYALMFVGVGVLSFITFFAQFYLFGRSGEALTKRLRDMCFRSMMKQKFSWFDDHKNSVGALTTRLATDAALVQGVTGHRLGGAVMSLSSIVIALLVAFIHGWQLTLVLIGLLPILIIGGILEIKVMAGQSGKNKEAFEIAGKVTVESIENIRTVASLSKESKFLSVFMQSLEGPHRAALKNCHMIGIMYGISQGVMYFTYAVCFAFGAFMMEKGEMNLDDIFVVYGSIVFGSIGLGYATAFAPDLGKAQASASRIIQIIDSEPAQEVEGKKLDDGYKAEIAFKDVEFSYPNRKTVSVLQGLTFKALSGQTLALVGSSGCGKSTSIQLIERFYDCTSGYVALDDYDIKDLDVKWLREQIGIVFQEPVLFDTSIAENIAYGDNTRTVPMDVIVSAARHANIHSFIASLPEGYDTNVGPKGTQLSGGQKQRIAIARALVRNPNILLLDEATSALDTESEKIVQEALDKAREGRTCIVIAHRLSTVQNADKICVIRHGKVSECGTHNELMAKQGFYCNLVRKSVRDVHA